VNGTKIFGSNPLPRNITTLHIAELADKCHALCTPPMLATSGAADAVAVAEARFNVNKQTLTFAVLIGEAARELLGEGAASDDDDDDAFDVRLATNVQHVAKRILQLSSSSSSSAAPAAASLDAAALARIEAELCTFKNLVYAMGVASVVNSNKTQ
jgi:hypothetical protein